MASEDIEEVSAASLVREFAGYRRRAKEGPLAITNHGRITHYLLSAAHFSDLNRSSQILEADTSLKSLQRLIGGMTDGVIVCDPDLRFVAGNANAESICAAEFTDGEGQSLETLLKAGEGTTFMAQVKRTAASRQSDTADMMSPFIPDRWLNLTSYFWRNQVVLLFRDITQVVQDHRLANVKEALLDLIDTQVGIGYVRLSLRGSIDRMGQSLREMLEFDEGRLKGVVMANLVTKNDRAKFRQCLENAMADDDPHRARVTFLTNSGGDLVLDLTVKRLVGEFGAEGFIVLATTGD